MSRQSKAQKPFAIAPPISNLPRLVGYRPFIDNSRIPIFALSAAEFRVLEALRVATLGMIDDLEKCEQMKLRCCTKYPELKEQITYLCDDRMKTLKEKLEPL